MSAYACSIYALKYKGGRDYFPLRINIGDVIELRHEADNPYDRDAVAAFHEGRKLGYLAREKQTLWSAIEGQPHRVIVIGKLSDEDGELVSLDVEISVVEKLNEQGSAAGVPVIDRGIKAVLQRRTLPKLVAGLAVLIVAFAVGNQVLIGNVKLHRFAYIPKQTAPSSEMANRLQPPADLFEDIPTKQRDHNEYHRRKLAKVPQDLQRMYISLSYRQLAEEAASRQKMDPPREAEELSVQEQADELRRKSQEAAARRLIEQQARRVDGQREKDSALRELNDRELIQHRQRMTAWQAEALALQQQADELWRKSQEVAAHRLVEQQKRQADEQREKALALQELNDRVLLHHRQRMAAWELRSKRVGFLQAVKIQKWKTSQPEVHKKISHSAPIKLRKKVVERVIAKAPRKKDFSRRTRESNNAICRGSLYRRCYY